MNRFRYPFGLSFLAFLIGLPAALVAEEKAQPRPASGANIHQRGSFQNARIRFEREKKGHVAFIGGSITEMNGYRPMVTASLKRRFPQTKFTFTDAGIASTCSTTGAFRLKRHVLDKGPVDLFFVEFAVNDDQDAAHARREAIRGMEGIVRHTRRHNPMADIVVTHFVNPPMLKTWQSGKTPLSVVAHEKMAKHYAISTINLGKETASQITAGSLSWRQYGGTHPKPHGNRLCAAMIDRLMDVAWKKPLAADARRAAHPMPKQPIDAASYFRGRLIEPGNIEKHAKTLKGMTVQTPAWSKLKGACRSRFVKETLLCADQPGAEMTLAFEGTAVGAYVLAGPDAGIVEASIDGGKFRSVNLYHRFSRGLHYPRTVMFDAGLKQGRHTLRLRVSREKDARSLGHAMRALYFVAN